MCKQIGRLILFVCLSLATRSCGIQQAGQLLKLIVVTRNDVLGRDLRNIQELLSLLIMTNLKEKEHFAGGCIAPNRHTYIL
jgi:hypothetical protein